ncbi:WAT1-related protein At3g28050-like isoform X1 [Camellia sinensis]|uniref:WAT1-related protein At3g28050-like isoform X1 n=1 Tax=Camellia sinensis TaxID=4442 RepID=UPI00103602E1|nr:WAT1-related protein At3g28050-like isoform X1 [Camellia sinensis]XP_028093504.1 WAT1-related protein At3g28050-like isoform X1 [Camellia sinensis]
MMGLQSWMKKELPFAVMVMLEFGDVCTKTLTKAAMNTGMNSLVFVVYHNALGTLILLPLFIFHRHSRTQQPPLSFSLLCRFSLLGLLGTCLVQICLFTGINYSSPTLAVALGNLFPAFTFLLAVLFRMEKFDLRKPSRQAKSLGTIVAVLGAFVMTLYKGPPLLVAILPSNLPHRLLLSQEQPNWVLGGLFLGISCLSSSIWNIVQTATIKEYPDEITVVFFYCFFGTIQCTIFSLISERNPTAWILTPGVEMISVVFSAIYGTVFRTNALTWCLHKKGPVYLAMFKPTNDYCSGL